MLIFLFISVCSLVPRPHPQKVGKGSGDFGQFPWLASSGRTRRHAMGALEQSSDLIGQHGCVGDSNLYTRQWPCYIPVASESHYD